MIDLTLTVDDDLPNIPGHPALDRERLLTHEDDDVLVHYFSLNAHHGTHVDAPAHHLPEGKTIAEMDVSRFQGPAQVVDLTEMDGREISADVLSAACPESIAGDRVVLVTGDVDEHFFDPDFTDLASYVTVDGAEWLVERGVKLVANDCLTEAVPGDPSRPVHHTLFEAEIPIAEYLANTAPLLEYDEVDLSVLPLKIADLEASPVRAVATV